MDTFSKTDILKDLRAFCKEFPTAAQAAAAIKITPAQLSQTLNGKKNVIPERILKKLGYRIANVYVSTAGKKAPTRKIHRSSETGHVVTAEVAKANPATTQTETMKRQGGVIHPTPSASRQPTAIIDVTARD